MQLLPRLQTVIRSFKAKSMRLNIITIFLFVLACNKRDINPSTDEQTKFISAVDISHYPEIKISNPTFYDTDGVSKDFISILKSKGINTVRLRLWVNPANGHSGFNEVKQFSETLKANGFRIWLALHYSDTWADPGQQQPPNAWQHIEYAALKDSVYTYTKKVMTQIQPDYIQIGNEINSGFLHPYGDLTGNRTRFIELLQKGILAVREKSDSTKIIIHFAGIQAAEWFFSNLTMLDYDIIGLSYYPIWHGKSLNNLKNIMVSLSQTYKKDILIAETAYPFTLQWNDWTNNIVGLENQLILPEFPATATGQKDFVKSIIQLTKDIPNKKGIGFCYWGAESIAWKGPQATNASSWENQALFDFQNKALPVIEEFKNY